MPSNQHLVQIEKDELHSRLSKLTLTRPWFHHFDLPYGLKTREDYSNADGRNTRKWERILPLINSFDVKGKRILDVGCSEGFFSSKLASMGASGLGIDADPICIEKASFIQEVMQLDQFDFKLVDIYSAEFERLPSFDLTLCLGFLHRIPDPYMAIKKLVERSDAILFEWKTFRHPLISGTFAYMKPLPEDQDNPLSTRYWSLSYECLEFILKRLGYKWFRRIQDENTSRAILIAGRAENPVFSCDATDIVKKNRFKKIFEQTKYYLKRVIKTLING